MTGFCPKKAQNYQKRTKIDLEMSSIDTKTTPKWCQNNAKMGDPKMTPDRPKSDPQSPQKWPYLGPIFGPKNGSKRARDDQ